MRAENEKSKAPDESIAKVVGRGMEGRKPVCLFNTAIIAGKTMARGGVSVESVELGKGPKRAK